jgi:hypothetical protein
MNEFVFNSLLRCGTKTWYGGDYNTTLDLVFASDELRDATVKYIVYGTDYRSDYYIIEIVFDMSILIYRL